MMVSFVFAKRQFGVLMLMWSVVALAHGQSIEAETEAPNNKTASFTGTWQYEKTDSNHRQRQKSIAAATSNLGRLIRPRAQDVLSESTSPAKKLSLKDGGDTFSLQIKGRPITLRLDNKAIEVETEKGTATVSAFRKQGKVYVFAKNKTGTRSTEYQLSENGNQLVLTFTIANRKLSKTISYQQAYTRQ